MGGEGWQPLVWNFPHFFLTGSVNYHGFRFADYLQPFVYGGVSARRMVSMGALGQLQHNMRDRGRGVGAAV